MPRRLRDLLTHLKGKPAEQTGNATVTDETSDASTHSTALGLDVLVEGINPVVEYVYSYPLVCLATCLKVALCFVDYS